MVGAKVEQLFDLTSYTTHIGRDTTGNLLSKGALLDRARTYMKGLITIEKSAVGTSLTPGATVATLVTSRDEHSVVAPHGGTIVEWLVEDGDPVYPGQPIIRLHPEAVHS